LDILTLKIWSLVPSSAIGKWAKKTMGKKEVWEMVESMHNIVLQATKNDFRES
jgi:hypothetical protein